jgi:acetylornithine deacetylase
MPDAPLQAVLQRIDANRAQLVEDVASCVRIPSVVGHEGQVQQFMQSLYRRLDLELDVYEAELAEISRHPAFVSTPWPAEGRPNVVGTLRGTDATARSLAINGHIDVVSPEPVSAWSHDPWGAELVGDGPDQRMYGRGALDMKSGTVAGFHALKAILDCGLRPRGTVSLQSVVEEEAGGSAGTLATLLRGHTADALLNPEPSYRTILVGQPGVMLFRVTVVGKTAHAAVSQEGINAIGKMLPLYQAMVDLDAERATRWIDPFFGGRTGRAVNLNIGVFQAGDWPSTVAGRAVMECRMAFIPPQTRAEVRREVESRIADIAATDPWLREHPPAVEWFGWQADPWRQDDRDPFIITLGDAVERVAGIQPPRQASTGGLDARLCGPFGIPAACIGARGANMHGIDEYVEIDSIVETTKIIGATIISWCGVAG